MGSLMKAEQGIFKQDIRELATYSEKERINLLGA
jgi:hypothetical protein